MKPQRDTRLIYHADGYPWEMHIPLKPKEEDLYEFVDCLADSGVDVLSLMGFCQGHTIWRTVPDLATQRFSKFPQSEPARLRLERLFDLGVEPIEAYARRCRERGMKFHVKFRMNDNHGGGKPRGYHHNILLGHIVENHPEWWLKDYPGQLDYTHQAVRDWMYELVLDVVRKFDIDGLCFNYMRWVYVFEQAESIEKQPILTGFMRRVHRMLEMEGKRRGGKLDLGVIIPPSLEECHNLGLDVPTWIEEGIIDYVCPSHQESTIFNAGFEEFVKLAQGSKVRVYPAIHGGVTGFYAPSATMSLPAYRAVTRNIRAGGADGISMFNYHMAWAAEQSLWSGRCGKDIGDYREQMAFLKGLWSSEELEKGDRHYITWPSRDMSHLPALKAYDQPVVLERREGSYGEWDIRCAETFDGAEKALVSINIVNLLPDDQIELYVNSRPIAMESIIRTYHPDGRGKEGIGAPLYAYTNISFVPTSPPFSTLDNQIGIKLKRCAPDGRGRLIIPETDVIVSANGKEAQEIRSLVDPHFAEPITTLAGYLPDRNIVYIELEDTGGFEAMHIGERKIVDGEMLVTKGAQLFAVPEETKITRVDILISRIPEVQESLRMSVRKDKGGIPDDEPLSAKAVGTLDPWEHPDGLTLCTLQGYYRFKFEKPLGLLAGMYWLVLEMDPSKQPPSSVRYGDPPHPSSFAVMLTRAAYERYPEGNYMTWIGSQWKPVEIDGDPLSAYFGIFAQ